MHRSASCLVLLASLAFGLCRFAGICLAENRLGTDVVPVFESVDLKLDAGKADYTGSVHVDLRVEKPTDTFRFHAESMTLDSVRLTRGGKEIGITHEPGEHGMVVVHAERKLSAGKYALDIDFSDDFNTDAVGLYRMEKDGEGYAFTQFEADDAREAFPCWDEPGFKIPWQLTLTVPESHLAVTNTPEKSETLENGWKRIVFEKTKPLPSYLLAIAAGPLETVDIPGLQVPGRIVTVKGQSQLAGMAAEITPPLLKALEDWFRIPYPYAKLDLIAVPEFWPGAMENAGAITFADRILLQDPASASPAQRRTLIRVTAHELSHMWFGDLVTMQWWDDLWLNESFADWMGDKIADEVYPENKQALSTVQNAQQIMFTDAQPSTVPIRRHVDAAEELLQGVGLAYNKGKAVLGMIESWTGPEAFRSGVVEYLKAHAWGNATSDDLWTQLNRASGKSVSGPLADFIEQPGVPLVHVDVETGGKIRLEQTRFHNDGAEVDPVAWRIPVGLRYAVGGKTQTRTILMDGPSTTVELEATPDWIFPNLDARGYYRWATSTTNVLTLADRAPELLNAKERIAFISNLGALLAAGSLGGDQYLRILGKLAADPEPIVAEAVLDALDAAQEALVPEDQRDAFAVYVRGALGPALALYGSTAKPGESETVSFLRPRLLGWLGDEGRDPEINAEARRMAQAYLDDPSSVDPALAGTYLALAAHDGDQALLDAYEQHLEAASNPGARSRYLSALGDFRNPELRNEVFQYLLHGPLRAQELFQVTRGMRDTPEGADASFRWLTQNYDAILGRIPAENATFMPFVAGGCSEERLSDAREFFSKPEHQAAGTLRTLDRVADQVTDCVNLRKREGENVARYLAGLAASGGTH